MYLNIISVKNIFLETQKLQIEAGQRWRNICAAPVWTGAGNNLPGGRIVLEQSQPHQNQNYLDITHHHIYNIYIHICNFWYMYMYIMFGYYRVSAANPQEISIYFNKYIFA